MDKKRTNKKAGGRSTFCSKNTADVQQKRQFALQRGFLTFTRKKL